MTVLVPENHGWQDIQQVAENARNTKVRAVLQTPGRTEEFFDDSPETINAIVANAVPGDLGESPTSPVGGF